MSRWSTPPGGVGGIHKWPKRSSQLLFPEGVVTFNVTGVVTGNTRDAIKEEARELGMSVSQLVRLILEEHVNARKVPLQMPEV